MKVCTDASLFGAWVTAQLMDKQFTISRVLDIGCGTGLLSMMLSQKIEATIDAIELDVGASSQASDNVSASKWKANITVINADIKQIVLSSKYELIISNPPFYENDLRAVETVDNMAKHNLTLKLSELFAIASAQLMVPGFFAVLIPYHRLTHCLSLAASHELFPVQIAHVKQSVLHNYFRSMILFKNGPTGKTENQELIIKDGNNYTPGFIELLKDYYLYL